MFIPTLAILLAFMHPSSPTMTAQDTGRVSSTSSSLHEPTRIPDQGQLPYMCDPAVCDGILAGERASRLGPYRGILQGIARTHFGRQRNDTVRLEGIRRLSTLTDTGYLFAMPDVYRAERNDVRRAVIWRRRPRFAPRLPRPCWESSRLVFEARSMRPSIRRAGSPG